MRGVRGVVGAAGLVLVLLSGAGAADMVDVEPAGPADAGNVAVSGDGSATCHQDLGFWGRFAPCLALAPRGDAAGDCATFAILPCLAVSGTGSSRACGIGVQCEAVSGTGDARGSVAVSGTGHASGNLLAVGGCDAAPVLCPAP